MKKRHGWADLVEKRHRSTDLVKKWHASADLHTPVYPLPPPPTPLSKSQCKNKATERNQLAPVLSLIDIHISVCSKLGGGGY